MDAWDGMGAVDFSSLPLLSSKEHCLVHGGLGQGVDMLFVPYKVT